MLDLNKLKQKLDFALSQETEESFKDWRTKRLKSGCETRTGQSFENGVVDIVWLPTKREFPRTEENKGLCK